MGERQQGRRVAEGRVESWAAVVDADRKMEQDARRLRLAAGAGGLLFAALLWMQVPGVGLGREPISPKRQIFAIPTTYRLAPPASERVRVSHPQARRVPVPTPLFDPSEALLPSVATDLPAHVEYVPGEIPFDLPTAPLPPAIDAPVRVGGEVSAPVKLYAPDPVMPELARKARRPGLVILEATIDREGFVRDVRVLKGALFGMDRAAVDAVERWRFEPGTLRGEPVPVLYNLTVRFHVE